jgi:DNA (cytosine-5)-methyltransferase 1
MFAGAGGFGLGFQDAGLQVLSSLELDAWACDTLRYNNPDLQVIQGDIRHFDTSQKIKSICSFKPDIIIGGPPCQGFSVSGSPHKDPKDPRNALFRDFALWVQVLQPSLFVMENVKGMLKVAHQVVEDYEQIEGHKDGKCYKYKVHFELLNSQDFSVAQSRERLIFIAIRDDIDFNIDSLDMSFNYEPITYGMIKDGPVKPLGENTEYRRLTLASLPNEKCIADVNLRLHNKNSGFQSYFIDDNSIVPTQRSKPDLIDRKEVAYVSKETIRNAQTFPQDYDFGNDTYSIVGYVCGMSVPPIMIKRIVNRLIESGVFR